MKNKRYLTALLLIGISLTFNAVLATVLGLILASPDTSFTDAFLKAFFLCFAFFGGSFIIAAILVLITKLREDLAIKYGAGFYYGTIICFWLMNDYFSGDNMSVAALISAVIVGLCCYIFWLKENKS